MDIHGSWTHLMIRHSKLRLQTCNACISDVSFVLRYTHISSISIVARSINVNLTRNWRKRIMVTIGNIQTSIFHQTAFLVASGVGQTGDETASGVPSSSGSFSADVSLFVLFIPTDRL